jgi:hypothetical protein
MHGHAIDQLSKLLTARILLVTVRLPVKVPETLNILQEWKSKKRTRPNVSWIR